MKRVICITLLLFLTLFAVSAAGRTENDPVEISGAKKKPPGEGRLMGADCVVVFSYCCCWALLLWLSGPGCVGCHCQKETHGLCCASMNTLHATCQMRRNRPGV